MYTDSFALLVPIRARDSGLVHVELHLGDLAEESVDAVVAACGPDAVGPSRVQRALRRAAGDGLDQSLAEALNARPEARLQPGEAVVTPGHELRAGHVIHCLPPRFGPDPCAPVALADCYRCALRAARDLRFRSLAFPSLGTGAYGFPTSLAARVAARVVGSELAEHAWPRQVRFVLASLPALEVYAHAFLSRPEVSLGPIGISRQMREER